MTDLSFAQTFILSNKVRKKLTKDIANPNASLRIIVTQANMLDNLMDFIVYERKSRRKERDKRKLDSYENPESGIPRHCSKNTSIYEYDVNSDSDSDSDSDSNSDCDCDPESDTISESESESESDSCYSNEETAGEPTAIEAKFLSVELSEAKELKTTKNSISLTNVTYSKNISTPKDKTHTVINTRAEHNSILHTSTCYQVLVPSGFSQQNHVKFAIDSLFR